jgi:hypothetical protein
MFLQLSDWSGRWKLLGELNESFSLIAPIGAGCRASRKHPVFECALDWRDLLFVINLLFVIKGVASSSSAPDLSPWGWFD